MNYDTYGIEALGRKSEKTARFRLRMCNESMPYPFLSSTLNIVYR